MPTKLMVTVERALRKKYRKAGWIRIQNAIDRLIAADKTRGIQTSLVALDKIPDGLAEKDHPASYKNLIDRLFLAQARPDYLVLLGGPDVIPHQDLINPVGDEDERVRSDLPYACDAPPSDRAETFLGPARVVGRIPDLPGDDDPALLEAILNLAAVWVPRTEADYQSCFGLSAAEWRKSTTLTLERLFGKGAKPHTSPKAGPKWTKRDLAPLLHFVNCHGAPVDPQYYGQKGDDYPVAHQAGYLPGRIAEGTVLIAECCYGAELYDRNGGTPAISISYLGNGALGFTGSTSIAYGPADSNGQADLIGRYFVESVRKGASLGRALLEARQRYVRQASPLSPVDLKTLAQFLLLGDPSSRPIGHEAPPETKSYMRRVARHTLTRDQLVTKAIALDQGVDRVASIDDGPATVDVAARLGRFAAGSGLTPTGSARTFIVRQTPGAEVREGVIRKAFRPVRFHLLFATPTANATPSKAAPKSHACAVRKRKPSRASGIIKSVILLAREVGGKVVKVDRLYAHCTSRTDRRSLRRHGAQEALRPRLEKPASGRGVADRRR